MNRFLTYWIYYFCVETQLIFVCLSCVLKFYLICLLALVAFLWILRCFPYKTSCYLLKRNRCRSYFQFVCLLFLLLTELLWLELLVQHWIWVEKVHIFVPDLRRKACSVSPLSIMLPTSFAVLVLFLLFIIYLFIFFINALHHFEKIPCTPSFLSVLS